MRQDKGVFKEIVRKNPYQRDYFEKGIETGKSLYSNYRWMPEMTVPMAATMIDYLKIKRGARVLDIGCAKGFLVKALRWLGRDAYGYDISDYAVANADPEVKSYLTRTLPIPKEPFHFAIAKDVFEHLPLRDLCRLLTNLKADVLFVIVPLGDGKRYNVPAYELDTTHIHRQPLIWWNELLQSKGWKIRSSVPRVRGIKDNWAAEEMGNGFIVAERMNESEKRLRTSLSFSGARG